MELVDMAINICQTITKIADNVKANKERCQRVAQRAKALQELVLTIKKRGPGQISVNVENALKEINNTLTSAQQIMMKYSQSKGVGNIIKSNSHEEKFNKINERLTDNFQLLSGALQVEQGDVLQKVYETVTAKTLERQYSDVQVSPSSIYEPMPTSSPTAPAPQTNIYQNLPMTSPTAPMPPTNTYQPLPMTSPTAPIPPNNTYQPLPMTSPTAPIPPNNTYQPLPMPSPSVPMPPPNTYHPFSMTSPTAHMAPPSTYHPVPAPMSGAMGPMVFSTPGVSQPMYAAVNPTVALPRPVLRIISPARAPVAQVTYLQNSPVIRGYMVNRPY